MLSGRPRAQTFGHLLEEQAQAFPDRVAVIDQHGRTTYGQLRERADRVAAGLWSLGVRRGDRVACLVSNRSEWLEAVLGALRIGATAVGLNTWYKQPELAWALRHVGATVLIAEPTFLKRDYAADLAAVLPEMASAPPTELRAAAAPLLRTVVYLGDQPRPGSLTWPELLALGRGGPVPPEAHQAVGPDDAALILYTSGSTAEPKGVVLRHGHAVANGFAIGERRTIVGSDRIWLGSPLFYGLGAVNALPVSLARGATLVLQGAFDAERALEVIERERCTVFYGMSNMVRMIRDAPGFHRDRVESLDKGTATIGVPERRILIEEMGVAHATQSYGLTEVYGSCCCGFVDEDLESKLGSAGTLLPGFEAKVVDPLDRRELPLGTPGLLLVRGHTADAYHQAPADQAPPRDADGFFDTGDLGSLDAHGVFRYTGRMKEMVKTGGINVSPTEVESILLRHPSIDEAYVVGVPDPDRGEALVAFVSGAGLSEEGVKSHVRDSAASFKAPSHVFLCRADDIPRVASGKVPKHVLRERALEALDRT